MSKIYNRYLESLWWKTIRNERLRVDNYTCVVCKSKSKLQVHHITYKSLYGEDVLNDLMTVCNKCHERIHGIKKKKKKNKLLKVKRIKGICKASIHDMKNSKRPKNYLP